MSSVEHVNESAGKRRVGRPRRGEPQSPRVDYIDIEALPRTGRIRAAALRTALNISGPTIWRWSRDGLLPKPVIAGWYDLKAVHEHLARHGKS